jgi:hypothetical protein
VTDDPLTLARTYVAAGLSVLPIKRGSKRPDARLLPLVRHDGDDHARPGWRPYEHRLASDAELTRWFAGPQPAGVGIIGGAISGGLLILDLESADAYQQWRSNAEALLVIDNVESVLERGDHLQPACHRRRGHGPPRRGRGLVPAGAGA